MEIKIKTVFEHGEIVYICTDPFQYKRIITSIAKDWNGGVRYEVSSDTERMWFQAIELSKTIDLQIVVQPDPEENDED